jgi:uncharacterized protein YndB with AHSA1/START domain
MQTSQTKNNHLGTHKNSTQYAKLLIIERSFNVPVERLYEAFTSSETLKIWWWPKDLYADRIDLDFREGGTMFINMKGFDKGGGGMVSRFIEIVKDQLIVMTDQFADENGRAITAEEAKMPGEWPSVCYITFEFFKLDEGSSQLRLSQEGVPNELQKDCIQGWTESFDKLEEYLRNQNH